MKTPLSNLGIAFRCTGDPRELYKSAKLAEDSCFSAIYLVEVNDVDTFAIAGALATSTSKISIATGVANSSLRLPTLLAMGAATVSDLSGGRFILGIGAGTPPVSISQNNNRNTELTRLKETLQCVRGCLDTTSQGSSPFSYDGRLYQIRDFRIGMPSFFRIPIYCAAMGEMSIQIGAKYSDGVILMLSTLDYLKKVIPLIDSELENRGLSRKDSSTSQNPPFRVACHIVSSVSDDPEQALKSAKLTIANYAKISSYHNHFIRQGFVEEVGALDKALSKNVGDEILEAVTERMARQLVVFGNAAECAAKVRDLIDVGISDPVIYPANNAQLPFPDQLKHQIKKYAEFIES